MLAVTALVAVRKWRGTTPKQQVQVAPVEIELGAYLAPVKAATLAASYQAIESAPGSFWGRELGEAAEQ